MAILIKKVSNKKDLKRFIRFNYELYKNNPYSVPDLYDDKVHSVQKKMQHLSFAKQTISWLTKMTSW